MNNKDFYDPHNYEKAKNSQKKILKKSKQISETNEEYISKYVDFCENLEEAGDGRLTSNLSRLRETAEKLGEISFKEASESDMQRVYSELKTTWTSDNTKLLYTAIVRKFYKWLFRLEDTDPLPEAVKWMKKLKFKIKYRLPEEMLSEEQVLSMVNDENNFRNKVIIKILFYSGARASEFLRLRPIDVVFDDLGAMLKLQQTKVEIKIRKVRIIEAAQDLGVLIRGHPLGKDSESPLWISGNNEDNKKFERLTYPALKKIVERAAKRAGIKLNVTPHLFRHSRATNLAKKRFTEEELRQFFGWAPGSKMPSYYVHLASKDLDNHLAEINGIKRDDKTDNPIKCVRCPRCQIINSIPASTDLSKVHCSTCGLLLDSSIVIKSELERKEGDKILDNAIQSLEGKEMLLTIVKEIVKNEIKNNNPTMMTQVACTNGNCKICPKCGKSNSDEAKFCIECGINFNKDENV